MTFAYVLMGVILALIFLLSFSIAKVTYGAIKNGDLIILKAVCFCLFLSLSDMFMQIAIYVMGELS